MKNYQVGVVGPVSGLSTHQVNEIAQHLREVLKVAESVTLLVWQDTSSRHPLNTDRADLMPVSAGVLLRQCVGKGQLAYAEFDLMQLPELRMCDTLFVCPGHAHTKRQRSRVTSVWQRAEEAGLRPRVVYAWKCET